MMWRMAGFEESLVSSTTRGQNEMGGLQKEIGFDVHHLYEPNKIKTRPIMVEKSQNLGNGIKTRRGELPTSHNQ